MTLKIWRILAAPHPTPHHQIFFHFYGPAFALTFYNLQLASQLMYSKQDGKIKTEILRYLILSKYYLLNELLFVVFNSKVPI